MFSYSGTLSFLTFCVYARLLQELSLQIFPLLEKLVASLFSFYLLPWEILVHPVREDNCEYFQRPPGTVCCCVFYVLTGFNADVLVYFTSYNIICQLNSLFLLHQGWQVMSTFSSLCLLHKC